MSTDTRGNGKTTLTTQDLDVSSKLDLIIESLSELNDTVGTLRDELVEKIANMSLPGDAYEVDSYDVDDN